MADKVWPYDYLTGTYPTGYDPSSIIRQIMNPPPAQMPVMPEAVRGGLTGSSGFTPSTGTMGGFNPGGGYTAASLSAPAAAPAPPPAPPPPPTYAGPTHQALSENFQAALQKQLAVPGLLSAMQADPNLARQAGGLLSPALGAAWNWGQAPAQPAPAPAPAATPPPTPEAVQSIQDQINQMQAQQQSAQMWGMYDPYHQDVMQIGAMMPTP